MQKFCFAGLIPAAAEVVMVRLKTTPPFGMVHIYKNTKDLEPFVLVHGECVRLGLTHSRSIDVDVFPGIDDFQFDVLSWSA